MPNVILESSDNKKFTVDVEVAKMSKTIKTMLEDLGLDTTEGKVEVIPLTNIRGDILKLVIEWSKKYHDDPPSPVHDPPDLRQQGVCWWDRRFLENIDQATLFELVLAANFLDIEGLLNCTCKTVANMIKGKAPEDIRLMFNIENDFNIFERQQIQRDEETFT